MMVENRPNGCSKLGQRENYSRMDFLVFQLKSNHLKSHCSIWALILCSFGQTPPDLPLVSSVFFMCLPDKVLVYGDCAINSSPTSEELATIAIQSADTAAAFGVEPKVAMLSYATGTSNTGNLLLKGTAVPFSHAGSYQLATKKV